MPHPFSNPQSPIRNPRSPINKKPQGRVAPGAVSVLSKGQTTLEFEVEAENKLEGVVTFGIH